VDGFIFTYVIIKSCVTSLKIQVLDVDMFDMKKMKHFLIIEFRHCLNKIFIFQRNMCTKGLEWRMVTQ